MFWRMTCKKLVLEGRAIKSVTDKELVQLLKDNRHESTHRIIVDEFNSRLIKPKPREEPKPIEKQEPAFIARHIEVTE
jgi:hypothetical protein